MINRRHVLGLSAAAALAPGRIGRAFAQAWPSRYVRLIVPFPSSGHGTSVHLSGEVFKRMAGIEMLHVPYRGAGPALNDLLPGRVDVMFNNIGAVLPLIQGDKLRGLAVTSAKRTPAAPQLPPIAEAGVPGFDVSSWYAFLVPAKTPPEIIRKMHADTV